MLPVECLIHSFQFLDVIQVIRLAKTCEDFNKIATTAVPLKFKNNATIILPTKRVKTLEIFTLFQLFGKHLKRVKIDAHTFDYDERFLEERTLNLITEKANLNIETLG